MRNAGGMERWDKRRICRLEGILSGAFITASVCPSVRTINEWMVKGTDEPSEVGTRPPSPNEDGTAFLTKGVPFQLVKGGRNLFH
jgi:hypothetical protein